MRRDAGGSNDVLKMDARQAAVGQCVIDFLRLVALGHLFCLNEHAL